MADFAHRNDDDERDSLADAAYDAACQESFLDHERFALERFRCPSCGLPLELIEVRRPVEERMKDPDGIALIAACRRCEIGFTKDDWHRRHAPV